jgi:hypothetical protein
MMSFMNATPNLNDVPHDLHPATVDLQGTRYRLTGPVDFPRRGLAYKDSHGTTSLVIEGVGKVGHIRADNVVPGTPEYQSAY